MELTSQIKEKKFRILYFSIALLLSLVYLDMPLRIIGEILFYIVFLIYFINKNKSFSLFSVWSLMMIFLSGLSIFWTADISQSLIDLRILTQMALISALLIGFIDSENKLILIYKSFVIAGISLVTFLITAIPVSSLLDPTTRIGVGMGPGMQNVTQNANDIGLNLTVSAIFTFYLFRREKKLYYIPLLIIFLSIIFLTGSRKAIVLFIIGVVAMIVLDSKTSLKLTKNIFISLILMIFAVYLLFNIPFLYEIAGQRIESLFFMLIGVGGGDGSTTARNTMISKGIDLISRKPLFGYGIGSYAKISGIGVYSHNNYIEVGVGLGLIGLVTYYYIYVFNIFNLIKINRYKPAIPLVILTVLLPFIEVGLVSYKSFVWNIILAVGFAVIKLSKSNN